MISVNKALEYFLGSKFTDSNQERSLIVSCIKVKRHALIIIKSIDRHLELLFGLYCQALELQKQSKFFTVSICLTPSIQIERRNWAAVPLVLTSKIRHIEQLHTDRILVIRVSHICGEFDIWM